MEPQPRTAEAIIRELGTRAHGVVTRSELLDAGLTGGQIKTRLGKGVLTRVYRGVYRVGHLAPSLEADYLAAVKACGGRAVLAGKAAAYLWELVTGTQPQPEVLTPDDREIPGVVVHRARRTRSLDHVRHREIPITSVPRTLVDLASSLPEPALARACHQAGVRYGTTPHQVDVVLARFPTAQGRRKLRRVLHGDVPVTLSRLEARFVDLLRKEQLPCPMTNRVAGSHRVDCRWPKARLTVELDSYRYHESQHAWDRDIHREREARLRGDEFRRYTWRDVVQDPRFMLRELRELLG